MTGFKVSSVADNKPRGVGQRHILVLMSFLGFCLSYAMRFNISIAIVAMTNVATKDKPAQHLDTVMFKTDVCSPSVAGGTYSDHNGVPTVPGTTVYFTTSQRHNNRSGSGAETFLSELNDEDLLQRRLGGFNLPLFSNDSSEGTTDSRSNKTFVTKYTSSPSSPISGSFSSSTSLSHGNADSSSPVLQQKLNETETSPGEGKAEFEWSESDQGFILGSFFYGYIVTQIPGGWMTHRFGGKWPFGLGLLITALLTIVTPFAARYGKECLVVLRIIQGLAGGVTCPATHGLLSNWIPPHERGQMAAFAYAGMPVGNAVSLIVSGYLINWFGWPSVFYLTGLAAIVWFGLWSYLIQSSPDEHPRIRPEEMKYIQNSIRGNSNITHTEAKKRPPWRKIWLSVPFWGILFAHSAETWGLYTVMTELPTYMKTVLHFDIEENSLLSALPHLLTWIVSIILTQFGDFCIQRQYATTTRVRKVCNTIALWGSAACLIGVAYSGCDRVLTVSLLFMGIGCLGGIYGGVLVNLLDIAPNYAGVLMGISNTCATVPGFLAPWVAGMLIDRDPSLERWRLVFLITASISFTGNLLYIMFASGEEQDWNRMNEDDDEDSKKQQTADVPAFGHFYTKPVVDSIEMGMRSPPDKEKNHTYISGEV